MRPVSTFSDIQLSNSRANERVYRSLEEIPEDAGYYSLIIAREEG